MTREQALENALLDIKERAEHECDWAKRNGEKQGNYRIIKDLARAALALPPDGVNAEIIKSGAETVYIYSMGKRLKLTAIATTDKAANKHCEKSDDAVIACFGRLVLMANKYDNGAKATATP